MDFRAHARQLLAIVGRQLRQLQLVNAGLLRGGLRLALCQLSLAERGGGSRLPLQAAFDFIERAARFGLLLRQLGKGVTDFARAVLLLLCLAALFQQLAADL